MTNPVRDKLELWRESSKGFKSRFKEQAKEPVLSRNDVQTSLVQQKIQRGDLVQQLRLQYYPSIDVEFGRVYAGSIEGSFEETKDTLMEMGFRNGPLAYVEVTERFGPDDGSFWLHIITETGKFPYIENRLGLFRRVKDQVHIVVWQDEEMEMCHLGAHREQSAMLQPARHVAINDSNAVRGIRDLRNKYEDETGEELPRPLDLRPPFPIQ